MTSDTYDPDKLLRDIMACLSKEGVSVRLSEDKLVEARRGVTLTLVALDVTPVVSATPPGPAHGGVRHAAPVSDTAIVEHLTAMIRAGRRAPSGRPLGRNAARDLIKDKFGVTTGSTRTARLLDEARLEALRQRAMEGQSQTPGSDPG